MDAFINFLDLCLVPALFVVFLGALVFAAIHTKEDGEMDDEETTDAEDDADD